MKSLLLLALLLSADMAVGQNIDGKWYGSLTQGPGGYRRVYNFELDIVQNSETELSGTSYAYIGYQIEAKIGFTGKITGDTITVTENIYQIQEEIAPQGWLICIKTLKFAHFRSDNKEFLRGRWTGIANGTETACVPGLLILARNPRDLKRFIEKNGYESPMRPVSIIESESDNSAGLSGGKQNAGGHGIFPDESMGGSEIIGPGGIFRNTVVSKLSEIIVNNRELQFYLLDYSKVDNDSVSVFLNRKILLDRVAITEKPFRITLVLNEQLENNELLFVADSQGDDPPNTAGVAIKDGDQWHKIKVRSDDQKSSAIYLKVRQATKSRE
jgi:hypothetical protein